METKTSDAMNSIDNAMERLAHLISQPDNKSNYLELNSLCISLYRGINDALANGETHPPKAIERLPMLIKKMNFKRKSDDEHLSLPGAMMVLFISVKYACEFGWFQKNESEELLTIAHKIGKIYNTLGNVSSYEPNSACHSSVVLTIMERFCPNMKLGRIIASVEARPGYGASVVDFLITKNIIVQSFDKTICLLVARTDNIATPACLISPQQVDFLLNGKAIDKRTMLQMDDGPQMPTCVNSMLKFGLNLLQAVGQFDGHYVILVAYMNYVVSSLSEQHPPPEYVQPNNKVHNCEKELQESGCSLDTISNVVDLSNKDNDLDIIMDTTETADRNPFQADFPVLAATQNRVPTIINMSATTQNRARSQLQYPYISGMQNELSNSHLHQHGSQANAPAAARNSQQARVMASSPVSRTDELRPPTSRMCGSLSDQQSYFGTHVSLPNPASAILNDTERQLFSRYPLNMPPQISATPHNRMPSVTNMSAITQNRSPSQLHYPYRLGILNEFSNSYRQQMFNHIQQRGSPAASAPGAATNREQPIQGDKNGQPVQEVPRTEPDQNWLPISRMRGSLSHQQLTNEIRQKLIMPSSPQQD